jgi:type VI secretion system protein ImpK
VSLIEKFHAFYREILAVDQRLRDREIRVQDARDTLKAHLERQDVAAEREGGDHGAEQFARAKYAMAALADEYFLRPGNPVRELWKNELLESALFKTQWAGEKLFRDIDALQTERRADTEDLARVYLAILGLEFRGKYADDPRPEAGLERHRRNLYRLVFGREPVEQAGARNIVPAAYPIMLEGAEQNELPYVRPWIFAIVLLFVLWIGISHAMWESAIKRIDPLVDDVLATSAVRPGTTP